MNQAIPYKILHRRLKFRNPNHVLNLPDDFYFSKSEHDQAQNYLDQLYSLGIRWTHPGDAYYPKNFLTMKEPPLFIEFKGEPFWMKQQCISIVGTRKIHSLTQSWLKSHLASYLHKEDACVVSGGAVGVDQLAHMIAMKEGCTTVIVVPSGLVDLYPKNLRKDFISKNVCFVSEFEVDQTLHKSHFYFRNRLIAAFGELTLMAQSDVRSGSFLTVHHALENGRQVVTLPAHPELIGFGGNLKLLQDGALMITNELDLSEIWRAELKSKNCLATKG